jgi:hypothetical protein
MDLGTQFGDPAIGEPPQFVEQRCDLRFDPLMDALAEAVWRGGHDLGPSRFLLHDQTSWGLTPGKRPANASSPAQKLPPTSARELIFDHRRGMLCSWQFFPLMPESRGS